MIRAIGLTSMLFVGLSGCTEQLPSAETILGSNPVLDGGSYSTGGGLTLAGEIQNVQGMTALCGVWADGNNQSVLSLGKSTGVISAGSAYIDDRVIHRGLAFMRKVEPNESYAGLAADCVVLARPWQDGDRESDVEFRLPRKVVHVEASEFTRLEVVFRQTGPGA